MPSMLDLTVGALEIGTLLSVALYGLTALQIYIYFQGVYNDHSIIRTLVTFIWFLDTIHTIFVCISLYHVTVSRYGQLGSINELHWTFYTIVLVNGILSVVVQSFFGYRIKVLSGRLAMGILSWAVGVVRMGTTLILVILAANAKDFRSYTEKYWWTIPVAASVQAFGDVLNTSALCFFLSMRRTGHRRTNRLITKAILWTIETGLVTTICAVTTVILCVTMPSSLTWVGLYFFFPNIYSISMLVSLNSRDKLRNDASEKPKEEKLSSSMQMSFSRPQEAPTIEIVSMRSRGEWDGLGRKPAPLE